MTAVDDAPSAVTEVDPDRLMAFVFRAVEEVGAALNGALVVTPAELALRTNSDEHYAREWLNAQAAGSFVSYDAAAGVSPAARTCRGADRRKQSRVRGRLVSTGARNRL